MDPESGFRRTSGMSPPCPSLGLVLLALLTWPPVSAYALDLRVDSGLAVALDDPATGTARGIVRLFGADEDRASGDGEPIDGKLDQVDLHVGYRYDRFDLAIDAANLVAAFSPAAGLEPGGGVSPQRFSCKSGSPLGGAFDGAVSECEDLDDPAADAFVLRVLATLTLD